MRRYEVCETTDAFEKPYAIWDNTKNNYYASDGIIQTFEHKKSADRYQKMLSEKKDYKRSQK